MPITEPVQARTDRESSHRPSLGTLRTNEQYLASENANGGTPIWSPSVRYTTASTTATTAAKAQPISAGINRRNGTFTTNTINPSSNGTLTASSIPRAPCEQGKTTPLAE